MNLLDFLISPAFAQATPGTPGTGSMIRPHSKRLKEQRAMLEKLAVGDEVITSGGIAGRIHEIGDNFISVEIADNVRIRVQKGAIGNVLPKGTLKSL